MDPQRYRDLFCQEAQELLQSLNQSLLILERVPADESALAETYRVIHTLKGAAATVGYQRTTDFCHSLESVLDVVLKGNVVLTHDVMDLLFKSADQLERLTTGGEGDARWDEEAEALLDELAHAAQVRLPATPVSHGESAGARARPGAAARPPRITTLRIDVKRLDSLINLTGELLITKSRLRTLGAPVDAPALREAIDQLDRISDSLQREVLRARMLPIGSLFGRFSRTVRDLARESGKEVDLVISGQEIELDRIILDDLSEPLIHLVRNAISHGIESPEARARLGKPTRGTITLSASREADRVILEVRDDGKGIDPEEVRGVAVRKGFCSAEQAQALSHQELMAFLFLPGFSTATGVTEVSGRGIGLNVVKTRVEALKGSIELKTAPNEGLRFLLRFPPTLAIVEALLVGVGEEMFAIPMADVSEVLEIHRADFEAQNILVVHGKAIPLVDLARALGLPYGTVREAPAFVLISSSAEGATGVIVDQVAGRQEIVIKPVEHLLNHIPGLSGATVLGDGRVVLILDLHALLRREAERLAAATRS